MKARLSVVLLLVIGTASVLSAEERRVDKSKLFSYVLPAGWKLFPKQPAKYDIILLPSDDGFNRNIFVNDQPGPDKLPVLKQKYERDLPKAFKGFELVSSELFELPDKRQVLRIIHTNTAPGIPVRQVNYIVEVGARRFFLAFTVLKKDGDKFDKDFADFVSSLAEPGKKDAAPATEPVKPAMPVASTNAVPSVRSAEK
jgi:hypothetical protein